jgi:putative FmdB family regulatory protein
MPLYEYICPRCKTEFDLRLSFSETSRTATCPKCSSKAQRLISSFACKTGGNIQAAEKPFRKEAATETGMHREAGAAPPALDVLITPPPNRIELLSSPGKKSIGARHKKK